MIEWARFVVNAELVGGWTAFRGSNWKWFWWLWFEREGDEDGTSIVYVDPKKTDFDPKKTDFEPKSTTWWFNETGEGANSVPIDVWVFTSCFLFFKNDFGYTCIYSYFMK